MVGDKILELGIGLESANDHVRNNIINKDLSKKNFERAVRTVKNANCDLLVYLLIKPPLLSEEQAINDAIDSAKYVFDIANKYSVNVRVAYEPVFVCKNTPLEKLFLNGGYSLVRLWSVIEVVKSTYHLGSVFVGLSDENLSFDRMPGSCKKCYKMLVKEIERFNKTQDASVLDSLDCECRHVSIAT